MLPGNGQSPSLTLPCLPSTLWGVVKNTDRMILWCWRFHLQKNCCSILKSQNVLVVKEDLSVFMSLCNTKFIKVLVTIGCVVYLFIHLSNIHLTVRMCRSFFFFGGGNLHLLSLTVKCGVWSPSKGGIRVGRQWTGRVCQDILSSFWICSFQYICTLADTEFKIFWK
jgi:hypothetical protein